MSIASLLSPYPLHTPPSSPRNKSSEDNHVAKAPLVPQRETTASRVNLSASTASGAEMIECAIGLFSMRSRKGAKNADEAIVPSVEDELSNAARINAPTIPDEDGKTRHQRVDRSTAALEAAHSLLLIHIKDARDRASVSALVNLSATPHECTACLEHLGALCATCLEMPWRQRTPAPCPWRSRPASLSPFTVANDDSSSTSDSEGPAAQKQPFVTSCHGTEHRHFAQEGNAAWALEQLIASRKRNQGSHDGQSQCYRCTAACAHAYGSAQWRGDSRESTVSMVETEVEELREPAYGARNRFPLRKGVTEDFAYGGTFERTERWTGERRARVVAADTGKVEPRMEKGKTAGPKARKGKAATSTSSRRKPKAEAASPVPAPTSRVRKPRADAAISVPVPTPTPSRKRKAVVQDVQVEGEASAMARRSGRRQKGAGS